MSAFSPAAERNQGPLLEILARVLPASARVLEIASGTGQHAAHFAAMHPDWRWQPSDGDAQWLADITARCAALANVAPPLHLDVERPETQPAGEFDAVYCANLIHIAPWTACAGVMRVAASHLVPAGVLVLYGPYLVDGEATAPSNLAFDADLRSRDARWGLRRLADVENEARAVGLALERRFAMPANNLMLVFRFAAAPDS